MSCFRQQPQYLREFRGPIHNFAGILHNILHKARGGLRQSCQDFGVNLPINEVKMAIDGVVSLLRSEEDVVPHKMEKTKQSTLGSVRLRHHETNEIILVPTPSGDPNDPLNW